MQQCRSALLALDACFSYNRHYSKLQVTHAMHHIFVQYAVPKNKVPTAGQLKKWAKEVLKDQQTDVEITIRIVDIIEMIKLNTQYRHKEGATNVLSFPFDELVDEPIDVLDDVKKEPLLLGDIAICADVVNQEAEEQTKQPMAHWAHMVVHGTLHLLGYDHGTVADANIMEPLEIAILKSLGFPNPYLGNI